MTFCVGLYMEKMLNNVNLAMWSSFDFRELGNAHQFRHSKHRGIIWNLGKTSTFANCCTDSDNDDFEAHIYCHCYLLPPVFFQLLLLSVYTWTKKWNIANLEQGAKSWLRTKYKHQAIHANFNKLGNILTFNIVKQHICNNMIVTPFFCTGTIHF